MKEQEWVKTIIGDIEESLKKTNKNIRVVDGYKLPYSSEILSYIDYAPASQNLNKYETDILILERLSDVEWKPRVIIETKLNRVTTHDAITYSQKAQTHRNVHPYLRYGILIGKSGNKPLSGRLFRHGQHFDFMQVWKGFNPDNEEWSNLLKTLRQELKASKSLDEIIFNTRSQDRDKYTLLHKPLKLVK